MGAAIDRVLGLTNFRSPASTSMALTDRSIVRRASQGRTGEECTTAEIDACIEQYLLFLADEIGRCTEYIVLSLESRTWRGSSLNEAST